MKKFIGLICVLIAAAAIYKTFASAPKELEKITSPDGKITVTVSEKAGNIIVESNRTNPLIIDYENKIEYGMSAFSRDSRYLFVVPEKNGYGNVEYIDFQNNRWKTVNIASIIRSSDEFSDFVSEYDIEECHEQKVAVLDIYRHGIANVTYRFSDRDGKNYTPFVWIDLINQSVEVFK